MPVVPAFPLPSGGLARRAWAAGIGLAPARDWDGSVAGVCHSRTTGWAWVRHGGTFAAGNDRILPADPLIPVGRAAELLTITACLLGSPALILLGAVGEEFIG
jgi:hypothetical protein